MVAGEVRTLAQQSADEAKEIKSVIGRSVGQVEAGTQLVDQAGAKMDEIQGSIRRLSDIVSEISAASAEQGAAAAERLRTQARQLVDSVAVFRLSA